MSVIDTVFADCCGPVCPPSSRWRGSTSTFLRFRAGGLIPPHPPFPTFRSSRWPVAHLDLCLSSIEPVACRPPRSLLFLSSSRWPSSTSILRLLHHGAVSPPSFSPLKLRLSFSSVLLWRIVMSSATPPSLVDRSSPLDDLPPPDRLSKCGSTSI